MKKQRMITTKKIIIASGLFLFVTGQAQAADILPHQAHYSLKLEQVNMPGMSSSRGGDFFLRIEKSCNSWVIASQFSFNMESDEAVPVNMVMLNQWEETLDGQSMRFVSQTIVNGSSVEFYEGVANNGKNDAKSKLFLSRPTEVTYELPANVYFPLSATKQSLANIANGQVVQNYILYDGSNEKAVRVSDLLAGKATLSNNLPESVLPYIKEKGWKVVTSFYDIDGRDSEATSTHVADIYDNGVTTSLKITNPQLIALGTLDQFEALPAPNCN